MKITTLVGLITGLAMVGASIFSPSTSHAKTERIYSKEFTIPFQAPHNKTRKRKINIYVDLNKSKYSLSLHIEPEGYDRKNWTRKQRAIPLQFRYALVEPADVYVLHPEEISIKQSQEAHIISKNKIEKVTLIPLKGSAEGYWQWGLRKLFGSAIGDVGGPFSGEAFDKLIDYIAKERKQGIKETVMELNENYVPTEIEKKVANRAGGLGYQMTAIRYRIFFDESHKIKGKIPVSLWVKPNFPFIKKGKKLENIVINFSLDGRNKKYMVQNRSPKKRVVRIVEDTTSLPWTGTDGNIIVFRYSSTRKGEGDKNQILYCDLKKREKRELVEKDNLWRSDAALSPKGNRIAYYSYNVDRNKNSYNKIINAKMNILNLYNGRSKKIPFPTLGYFFGAPYWSKDNNHVFFVVRSGKEFMINIKNGKLKRTPKKGPFMYNFRWMSKIPQKDRKWCFE